MTYISLSPGPSYHIHEMKICHVLVFFSKGGGLQLDWVAISLFTIFGNICLILKNLGNKFFYMARKCDAGRDDKTYLFYQTLGDTNSSGK